MRAQCLPLFLQGGWGGQLGLLGGAAPIVFQLLIRGMSLLVLARIGVRVTLPGRRRICGSIVFSQNALMPMAFPPVEARLLMLSSGSGCSPMTSSPLISPRLWESRLTQLKVWRPPRPSGRCTCAGHLWRWWVVYAPNFPGSTTWLCEPLLACLFPCHSCAFHTLSRDLQVWRRGHLVPHSVLTQLDVSGGERPRLRM